MLEKSFLDVYTKFKLHFYQQMFQRFQDREASLTTVETFCAEIIYDLEEPTISEFADFVKISAPNAAYKVNSLIKKGYAVKVQSETDRREYHLRVTDRFMNYYNINGSYIETVMERCRKRFSADEIAAFEQMLGIISDELTPEIQIERRATSLI